MVELCIDVVYINEIIIILILIYWYSQTLCYRPWVVSKQWSPKIKRLYRDMFVNKTGRNRKGVVDKWCKWMGQGGQDAKFQAQSQTQQPWTCSRISRCPCFHWYLEKKNHSNKVFPALEHRPNHCSNWVPSVFRPNQKGLTFYQPQTLVTGTSPKYWLATSKSRSPRFARARAFLAFFLPVQVASSRGLQVWMGQKPFNRFSVGVCWQ